jgi:hypothetical protein
MSSCGQIAPPMQLFVPEHSTAHAHAPAHVTVSQELSPLHVTSHAPGEQSTLVHVFRLLQAIVHGPSTHPTDSQARSPRHWMLQVPSHEMS